MIQAYGKNIIVKPIIQKEENKKFQLLKIKDDLVYWWEVISVGRKVEEINKGEIINITPYGVTELANEEGLFVTTEEHVLAKKDI